MNGFRYYFPRFAFALFLIVFLGACGLVSKGAKVSYPNKVNSEMKAEFDRVEEAFKNKSYEQAEAGYRGYTQHYPYNALTDLSNFRIGQILMLRSQYQEANNIFSTLIQKTPDPEMASRARVKAGICEYRVGDFAGALADFDKADGRYVRDHDKIKMGGLALLALDKTSGNPERRGYYLANLLDGYTDLSDETINQKYAQEAPNRRAVIAGLEEWAGRSVDIRQVDSRLKTYPATASAPYVDYKLGMAFYASGDNKQAKKYLGDLVGRYRSSSFASRAQATLDKIGYKPVKIKSEGKVFKIGAILPLSGKYQNFGTNTLHGMECGSGQKPGCSGVANVQLITRDDGGDAAKAVQAVDELVQQEKVVAIVGPLSSGSALAAAKRAQELGVVMISLAQKEGITESGNNVFRFSLTPNEQVRTILSYATKNKGKKLLAIMYPNSNYGKVFFDTFKQMAGSFGATVSAAQAYGGGDISNELRQLKFSVEKSSPEAPLGFDGLFIPDSYMAVLKIAPHLKNAGMDGLLLLGTNAWDDPALAQKSGELLGNSVFPDIYFKDSANPRVKAFTQEYQTVFGQAPSTLDAMGYDVIRFVGQALSRKKVSTNNDVRDAISMMRGYQGVTGLRSFLSDREASVEPYLLTVEGNQIKEIH